MKLDEYLDKVNGCFMGKNIGGTLGAPFECGRGVLELDFYSQDMSGGAWPNDDLDLQLVWLAACERFGKSVNATVLGEYWLSFIVANWSEYGMGKNNMRKGLLPPISGSYNNLNKNSCGCFIRSEIWACLMPGHPELAVKYAFEDAIVDHGSDGVYGEIFFAAVQSAAFVESDTYKLIEIGLSYIPQECNIALGIKTAIDCFESGVDWKEARKKILQTVPGAFGSYRGYIAGEREEDIPAGTPDFDAPSNVAITVMAWLYGEGDFGRAVCIAAGCCEDADCTAATLGALMGIILGREKLPKKWTEPIGEGIKTVACNTVEGLDLPGTIGALTSKVCSVMPAFLGRSCDIQSEGGVMLHLCSKDDLLNKKREIRWSYSAYNFLDYIRDHDKCLYFENTIIRAKAILPEGINISESKSFRIVLEIENLLSRQQWLDIKFNVPDEWSVSKGRNQAFCLEYFPAFNRFSFETEIIPENLSSSTYKINIEIASEGRISTLYIPLMLINAPEIESCIKKI